MVDCCVNPKCMKPLLYLREGTVYFFEVSAANPPAPSATGHRIEHYWLCGDCSATLLLERTANEELRLVPKRSLRFVRRPAEVAGRVLAS